MKILYNKKKILLVLFSLMFLKLVVLNNSYFLEHLIAFVARKLFITTTFHIYEDASKGVQYYSEKDGVYLLNQPALCADKKPFLLIMIKTAPSNFLRRQAIRETWGNMSRWNKERNLHGLVLFFVGNTNNNLEIQASVLQEHSKYADIIQENYLDSFFNLTRKVVGQLKWTSQFCSNARFFMTTDDDMYINVPNLFALLQNIEEINVYTGCVHSGSSPIHDPASKYFVSRSVYPGLYYPDYCPGAGYILSINTVQLLYKNIFSEPMLYIDDVYIGILLKQLDIAPDHNAKFFCEAKVSTDQCFQSYFITSHGYTDKSMRLFHKSLSDLKEIGVFCSLKLYFRDFSFF